MLVINAESVHQSLNFNELVDALDETFSRPAGMPQRQVFSLDESASHSDAFAVLPSWNDKTIAVKAFTYFPGNPQKDPKLASLYSKILIFNRVTGEPQALVDGTSVTYWRTAAVSALGSRYLSREDSSKLLVCGTGNLASFMALAHASVRPITQISVWGRNQDKAHATMALIRNQRPDIEVIYCDNLEASVRNADIISCATGSPTPLFPGEWVQAGTHTDFVGNHNHDRRECDTTLIQKSAVFVDSKINVFAEAGELLIPIAEGQFCFDEVKGELAQLSQSTISARESAEQITLFKTVGTALSDLVGAQLVYAKLTSAES
ncbi:ornithine cyclodeaminase [Shewanella sp. Choline-02u-19]|uniref:ornithine cyclodeaminase family protein n=1 Tax=unclassified Shewanella TaxID=196818 RepID=UPI000C34F4D8|nr:MULTISPECIES: ornithine cyclodeaminase family protein [unclassified Shewanella]PKG56648.1 ornithine cyclodeaminase [Shewanella sp. GutDb-MelDb]PKH57643.1 ornithine cyclodeaminase [Shewanella sp. Bg11-22]PKI28505.1 ornithine cyclodeaminase [Shewanella sp. Choline-02u-19]